MNELDLQRASYARVSSIIGRQNEAELRSIPLEHLVEASLRGTAIHGYCSSFLKSLWIPEIVPEYLPYFEAFKKWDRENGSDVVYCDHRMYDDELRFTGEIDAVFKTKQGKTLLIDIKTSSKESRAWPLQLAAYRHLLKLSGLHVDACCVVHLKVKKRGEFVRDGGSRQMITPPVVDYNEIFYDDLDKSFDIFLSALECYRYFETKEASHV